MSFGLTHSNKKSNKSRRGRVTIKNSDIDVEKGEGFYGTVIKLLGDNRLLVNLNNGIEAQATFSGKFRKKIWIKIGNIVLLNESYEVQQIINDENKRSIEANNMMRKVTSIDDYFKNNDDDDDDDDDDEEDDKIVKKQNTEIKIDRKSKQEKTLTKRGGGVKIFSDPEQIKKDMEEFNNVIVDDDFIKDI
jgi:initiation factor 1A